MVDPLQAARRRSLRFQKPAPCSILGKRGCPPEDVDPLYEKGRNTRFKDSRGLNSGDLYDWLLRTTSQAHREQRRHNRALRCGAAIYKAARNLQLRQSEAEYQDAFQSSFQQLSDEHSRVRDSLRREVMIHQEHARRLQEGRDDAMAQIREDRAKLEEDREAARAAFSQEEQNLSKQQEKLQKDWTQFENAKSTLHVGCQAELKGQGEWYEGEIARLMKELRRKDEQLEQVQEVLKLAANNTRPAVQEGSGLLKHDEDMEDYAPSQNQLSPPAELWSAGETTTTGGSEEDPSCEMADAPQLESVDSTSPGKDKLPSPSTSSSSPEQQISIARTISDVPAEDGLPSPSTSNSSPAQQPSVTHITPDHSVEFELNSIAGLPTKKAVNHMASSRETRRTGLTPAAKFAKSAIQKAQKPQKSSKAENQVTAKSVATAVSNNPQTFSEKTKAMCARLLYKDVPYERTIEKKVTLAFKEYDEKKKSDRDMRKDERILSLLGGLKSEAFGEDDVEELEDRDALAFWKEAIRTEDNAENEAHRTAMSTTRFLYCVETGVQYWSEDGSRMVYWADRGCPEDHLRIELSHDQFNVDDVGMDVLRKNVLPLKRKAQIEGVEKEVFAQQCIIAHFPECQAQAAAAFLGPDQLSRFEKRAFGEFNTRNKCPEMTSLPEMWNRVAKLLRNMSAFRFAADQYANNAALEDDAKFCWPPRFKSELFNEICTRWESLEDYKETMDCKYRPMNKEDQSSLSKFGDQTVIQDAAADDLDTTGLLQSLNAETRTRTVLKGDISLDAAYNIALAAGRKDAEKVVASSKKAVTDSKKTVPISKKAVTEDRKAVTKSRKAVINKKAVGRVGDDDSDGDSDSDSD